MTLKLAVMSIPRVLDAHTPIDLHLIDLSFLLIWIMIV